MIRPRDRAEANRLESELRNFSRTDTPLPGVITPARRITFIAQLVESMRRVELVRRLRSARISARSTDPNDTAFNPIKAAIFHSLNGARDEAFWIVFLMTHFGKHSQQGWSLLKAVYGRLGANPKWSWQEVTANTAVFRVWLRNNQTGLVGLKFGNHRKYESIREDSSRGLADVVEAYCNWVTPPLSHDQKIQSVVRGINDPHAAFDALYRETSALHRWGRLAKFDHLTMLEKVGLLNASPGKAYLAQATGPRRGAALFLHNNADFDLNIGFAETVLKRFGDRLGVGQQEIEDSLCNWQKSPNLFVPFR